MSYITVQETPLDAHEAVGAILKRLQFPEVFGPGPKPKIMPDNRVYKVARATEDTSPRIVDLRHARPPWHTDAPKPERPRHFFSPLDMSGPQPVWQRYLIPGRRVEVWQAKNKTDVWVTIDDKARVLLRVVIRGLKSESEAEDLRAEFQGRNPSIAELERAVEAIVWAGGMKGRAVQGIKALRKQLEDLTPDYADAAFNGWVRANLRPDPTGRGMSAADLYRDYREFARRHGENESEKNLSAVTTLSIKKWGSTMRGRFEVRRDGHGIRYPLLLKREPHARKPAAGRAGGGVGPE